MNFYKAISITLVLIAVKPVIQAAAIITAPSDCSITQNKSQTITRLTVSGVNNVEDKWTFKFGNVKVIVTHDPSDENDQGLWNLELAHRISDFDTKELNTTGTSPGTVPLVPSSDCGTILPIPRPCSEGPPRLTGPDYEFHSGFGYYYVYKYYTGNFNMAKDSCAQDGSHLAVINSQEEADIIVKMMGSADKKEAYVGMQISSGTIFGDPISCTGFEQWNAGQPDTNYDCVVLKDNGKYATSDCKRDLSYVCEAEYPC